MALDICLQIWNIIVQIALAGWGIYVSLNPRPRRNKVRRAIVVVCLVGLSGVGVSVWAAYRNSDSQDRVRIVQEKILEQTTQLIEGGPPRARLQITGITPLVMAANQALTLKINFRNAGAVGAPGYMAVRSADFVEFPSDTPDTKAREDAAFTRLRAQIAERLYPPIESEVLSGRGGYFNVVGPLLLPSDFVFVSPDRSNIVRASKRILALRGSEWVKRGG